MDREQLIKLIAGIVLNAAEQAAKKTDSTLDDKVVAILRELAEMGGYASAGPPDESVAEAVEQVKQQAKEQIRE